METKTQAIVVSPIVPKDKESRMSKIKKTKQFVREHKTLVACGATAVGTCYFMRNQNLRGMSKILTRMDQQSRNLAEVIEYGKNIDMEMEMEHWNLWSFLNENNLRDDYFDYVKRHGLSIVRGPLIEAPISVS